MSSGFEHLLMCCICCTGLTPDTCAIDPVDGMRVDVCLDCAPGEGLEVPCSES